MPFDAGATAMDPFVLQRGVEDFSVEVESRLDQQHDGQGRHTEITAESIGSTDGGASPLEVTSGMRLLYGPLLIDRDNIPTDQLTAVVRTATITANQNDYNPPGLSSAVVLELEASADRTITGIEAGSTQTRRLLTLVNRSSYTITLESNSSSSLSRNRLFFGGSNYLLKTGSIVDLYYDPGAPIWRGPYGMGVRSIQTKQITFASGGGTTQNFTLDTALVDYSRAYVAQFSSVGPGYAYAAAFAPYLTSATNLAVKGDDAVEYTLRYTVIEY